MGSTRTKMTLALGVGILLVVVAGIAYVAGQESDDLVDRLRDLEATSIEGVPDGAAPVQIQPPVAGDATDGAGQVNEPGPAWRTNQVRIDQGQAESSAKERFAGARVLHAEIDEEDGYYLWEVLLQRVDGSYIEVFVDAGDGRVIGVDHEGFDD